MEIHVILIPGLLYLWSNREPSQDLEHHTGDILSAPKKRRKNHAPFALLAAGDDRAQQHLPHTVELVRTAAPGQLEAAGEARYRRQHPATRRPTSNRISTASHAPRLPSSSCWPPPSRTRPALPGNERSTGARESHGLRLSERKQPYPPLSMRTLSQQEIQNFDGPTRRCPPVLSGAMGTVSHAPHSITVYVAPIKHTKKLKVAKDYVSPQGVHQVIRQSMAGDSASCREYRFETHHENQFEVHWGEQLHAAACSRDEERTKKVACQPMDGGYMRRSSMKLPISPTQLPETMATTSELSLTSTIPSSERADQPYMRLGCLSQRARVRQAKSTRSHPP